MRDHVNFSETWDNSEIAVAMRNSVEQPQAEGHREDSLIQSGVNALYSNRQIVDSLSASGIITREEDGRVTLNTDENGNTILHYLADKASTRDNREAGVSALQAKAQRMSSLTAFQAICSIENLDVNQRNNDGKTAIEVAIDKSNSSAEPELKNATLALTRSGNVSLNDNILSYALEHDTTGSSFDTLINGLGEHQKQISDDDLSLSNEFIQQQITAKQAEYLARVEADRASFGQRTQAYINARNEFLGRVQDGTKIEGRGLTELRNEISELSREKEQSKNPISKRILSKRLDSLKEEQSQITAGIKLNMDEFHKTNPDGHNPITTEQRKLRAELDSLKQTQQKLAVLSWAKTQDDVSRVSIKSDGQAVGLDVYNQSGNKSSVIKCATNDMELREAILPDIIRSITETAIPNPDERPLLPDNIIHSHNGVTFLESKFIPGFTSASQDMRENPDQGYGLHFQKTPGAMQSFALRVSLDWDGTSEHNFGYVEQDGKRRPAFIDFDRFGFYYDCTKPGIDDDKRILYSSTKAELDAIGNNGKRKYRESELNNRPVSVAHIMRALHENEPVDRYSQQFLNDEFTESMLRSSQAMKIGLQPNGPITRAIEASVERQKQAYRWDELDDSQRQAINENIRSFYPPNMRNQASMDNLAEQMRKNLLLTAEQKRETALNMQVQIAAKKLNESPDNKQEERKLAEAIRNAGFIEEPNKKVYWLPDREALKRLPIPEETDPNFHKINNTNRQISKAMERQVLPPMTVQEYLTDKFLEQSLATKLGHKATDDLGTLEKFNRYKELEEAINKAKADPKDKDLLAAQKRATSVIEQSKALEKATKTIRTSSQSYIYTPNNDLSGHQNNSSKFTSPNGQEKKEQPTGFISTIRASVTEFFKGKKTGQQSVETLVMEEASRDAGAAPLVYDEKIVKSHEFQKLAESIKKFGDVKDPKQKEDLLKTQEESIKEIQKKAEQFEEKSNSVDEKTGIRTIVWQDPNKGRQGKEFDITYKISPDGKTKVEYGKKASALVLSEPKDGKSAAAVELHEGKVKQNIQSRDSDLSVSRNAEGASLATRMQNRVQSGFSR